MPQVGNLTAAAYAILRIWLHSKIANFHLESRVCEMRYVCNPHVACLAFVFSKGRLAMPRVRHGFQGTPRSLFRADVVGLVWVARKRRIC